MTSRKPQQSAILRHALALACVLGLVLAGAGVTLAYMQRMPVHAGRPTTGGRIDDADAAYRRGDYATALRLFRPLAEQGNASAQFFLGVMYRDGRGVPKNDAEAVKWYRLAADQGLAVAQNHLGFRYFNGRGVSQNDAEAAKWFRLAAEKGNASARISLGAMYSNGRGVPQNDTEAVNWYRLAADKSNASAQNRVGVAYWNGLGVLRDYVEAANWFRLAADQGFAEAQYNLGSMYSNGPLPQNYREAVKWYRLAADQGNAYAEYQLGVMYYNGDGVSRDYVSAHTWFNLAAVQFDVDAAVQFRDLVEQSMTSAQVTEAQKLAQERKFKPSPLPSEIPDARQRDIMQRRKNFDAYRVLSAANLNGTNAATGAPTDFPGNMPPPSADVAVASAPDGVPDAGATPQSPLQHINIDTVLNRQLASSVSVPLQTQGETYLVPVLINGAITLTFVIDSGASDVSIPADVLITLVRTGTVEATDFMGNTTYMLADGRTIPSTTFRLRSLKVGNKIVENVTGSVAPVEGPLLLGQSFLSRFKAWSIDNSTQALILVE